MRAPKWRKKNAKKPLNWKRSTRASIASSLSFAKRFFIAKKKQRKREKKVLFLFSLDRHRCLCIVNWEWRDERWQVCMSNRFHVMEVSTRAHRRRVQWKSLMPPMFLKFISLSLDSSVHSTFNAFLRYGCFILSYTVNALRSANQLTFCIPTSPNMIFWHSVCV